MTVLFWALLAPEMHAAPVENGVQAQIHPAGFEFLSDELSGSPWTIELPDPALEFLCYTFSIDNLGLSMEFGEVSLVPQSSRIVVDAVITEAIATDIALSATATGAPCQTFSTTVTELSLRNAVIDSDLVPQLIEDRLDVEFATPLDLQAETTINFDVVPDWLESTVVPFLEGALLNLAEDELEKQLPDLLAGLTVDGLLYQSEFAGVPIAVAPSAVRNTPQGLFAAASIDLGGDGGPGRIIDLPPRGSAHFAVGVTETMVEETAIAAWATGIISPESQKTNGLVADLLDGLGLGDDLLVQFGTNGVPDVRVRPEGIFVTLPKTELTVTNGYGELLLELEADLAGLLELTVDNGALLLTAHELVADVLTLEASRLLEDGPENLEGFLEGWVVRAAASAIDDLELYQSHFEALGYVLRINHSKVEDRAVIAWMTLYAEDDPAIDRISPDTKGSLSLAGNVLTARFRAADDRPGQLLFSYRLNEGSWSSWSEEQEVQLTAQPGINKVDVRSRDSWYNEDPTPASGTLTYRLPEEKKCGCATGTASFSVGWLALLGLVVRRRRQR